MNDRNEANEKGGLRAPGKGEITYEGLVASDESYFWEAESSSL